MTRWPVIFKRAARLRREAQHRPGRIGTNLSSLSGLSGRRLLSCGLPFESVVEAQQIAGCYYFRLTGVADASRQKLLNDLRNLDMVVRWYLLDGNLLSVDIPNKGDQQRSLLSLFRQYGLNPTDYGSTAEAVASFVIASKVPPARSPITDRLIEQTTGFSEEQLRRWFPYVDDSIIELLKGV
jgi:hypothetical protein